MDRTTQEFEIIIKKCRDVFESKMKDYGSAWRILRTSSLTDQIFIKASRIRNIDDKGVNKVDEGITPEFVGIVNYSVMALIQLELGNKEKLNLTPEEAISYFDKHIYASKALMEEIIK